MSKFQFSAASQQQSDDQLGGPRLMDKGWELIQAKTFQNWINNKLKIKNYDPINAISTDLSTGEKLIQLLEIIGDESLGKYNKNPKLRIQKVENVNTALAFIKKRNVGLTNIGSEDIVDSNEKLILGLIWSIILRFSIADISEEGLTAKEGLLLWVQKRTTPYKSDFFVKNFTNDWQDGLAFCGLIHRHRPDLLDYWSLDKSKRHENMNLAFEIAERELGIPKLFNVEDIIDVIKPDERSVMTYVAQYFHAFSQLDKLGNAGRRVGQFGQVMAQVWAMQNDYEKRVQALTEQIKFTQSNWSKSTFQGYADAKRQLLDFDNYKNTLKRTWVMEKRDLDTLLGNILTKLKTYNLPPYHPPKGLTPQDLEHTWSGQIKCEAERKRKISIYIKEIKEVLKTKYANAANQYQDNLNQLSLSITGLDGELDQQLNGVQRLISGLEPLKQHLKSIEELSRECDEANIDDNEYTIFSVEDLTFELGILHQSDLTICLNTTSKAFIENQMVARNYTNITPQQLEGYTESFRHFDTDRDNLLTSNEFMACLQAEGISITDAEVSKVFGGRNSLTFQQFIDFMTTNEEDKTTPEQLEISFAALALDKGYISEKDMYMGGLTGPVVDYFKSTMPRKDDGYDYKP
ncbi:hypothetical protein HDU92_006082, partial [Lobulomyces angularis]